MDEKSEKKEPIFEQKEAFVQRPLWLRVVLLIILLTLVGFGFYFANLVTIDRLQNR